MFKYVNVKNYKSLNNLNVDFSKTKSTIKNMAVIYGENGIGKSNFVEVFYTLHETLQTMAIRDIVKKILEDPRYDENDDEFNKIFKKRFKDIETIIRDCKTINSRENMVLEFGFIIDGKNGIYTIEMDNNEIVYENLDYVLNHNLINFFNITKDNVRVNENIFMDNIYYKEVYDLILKYWGKHSLLSILSFEVEDKKMRYIKTKIKQPLLTVLFSFNKMSIKIKGGNKEEFSMLGTPHEIFGNLENGKIPVSLENELDRTEKLLDEFFTSLYSDIDSVYYKRTRDSNELKYQLYVKKKIANNILDIDFSDESTGTQNLLDLLPFIISAIEGQIIIIDEFDTGIHDLLVEKILNKMFKQIKGQLIITTHNTRLLESQLPNNVMYLLKYNNGVKELVPFDYYERIQKNINLRKRYLSGYYDDKLEKKDLSLEKLILLLDDNLNK